MDLGVYIHFPWCRRRCPYCDFAIAVAPLSDIPHAAYADAVLGELDARAPAFAPGRTLRSIYFGGGTPALWDPPQIARLIAANKERFSGSPDEITVEANPNDADPGTLAHLRDAGVNRLSIGTQAFDDAALVQLGRDHDAAHSLRAVDRARAAGFTSVSLDLIYALPGRDLRWWDAQLDAAIAAAPDHLSVYQLTIEPRTTFGEAARRGTLTPAPDDDAAAQFEHAHERLTAAGYEHYEVSSYARPGKRAVHNGLYWRGADYLGLGNGAHSFRRTSDGGAERSAAPRSVVRYLQDPTTPAETTIQTADEVRQDLVWLGLRTSDGVDAALVRGSGLARLEAAGLVTTRDGRVRPTAKGLLFADELGATLLE